MLYTSAEANKLLRKLKDERENLINLERQSIIFNSALGENPETIRPEYDYGATQTELHELERKIRVIKHALNQFNISHTVPEFNMTIDEILVYIPQLSQRKQKLYSMQARLPKARENNYRGLNIVDYCIVNYDIKQARIDYNEVSDELSNAQTALDIINHSIKFEIDL